MGCIKVVNFIEMHDEPQTFLTVVDKMTVHSLDLYGVAIYLGSFVFTTGDERFDSQERRDSMFAELTHITPDNLSAQW